MGIKNYPNTPRVYVDMDGVIADFDYAANSLGMNPKEFKHKKGAYLNLKPIEGARAALEELERSGFFLFALTKIPSKNPHAASEKLLWIREHFPILEDRVIISPDKGAIGTQNDFLVDDHPEWANAENFPGTVVHFKGDWDDTIDQILRKM